MKSKILLGIVAFAFLFSCKKKDSSPSPSTTNTAKPLITAKVNGKDFKISNYTPNALSYMPGCYTLYNPTDFTFGDTTNGSLNSLGFQVVNKDTISVGFTIDQFDPITPGVYPFDQSFSNGCTLFLYLNGYEDASVNSVTGSLVISSISIDDNTLQGTYSGTFSAVVKVTPVGKPQETVTITDGVITNMKIN